MIRFESFEPYVSVCVISYMNLASDFMMFTLFMIFPLLYSPVIISGARFEFTLDEELKVAASCEEVKAALAAKISRERIGVEVSFISNISFSENLLVV